jgi:hypothetical protein
MEELINEHLDDVLDAYITAALWSTNDESTPEGGYPLDKNYCPDDVAPETLQAMRADCELFLRNFAEEIDLHRDHVFPAHTPIWEMAGHDLWLTRCGHGCGFWDGHWPDGLEKMLTAYCEKIGEVYLYVGDDGKIYS